MNEEKTKLHFVRVRAKGNVEYYDPQMDIRALLPSATELVLDVLDQIAQDEQLKQEFKYLTKCFRIFQIKIREDDKDLVDIVNEYHRATCKVSARAMAQWSSTMMIMLSTMYGLFERRDCAADKDSTRGMLNTAKLSTLVSVLPAPIMEEVRAVYKQRQEVLDESFKPKYDGTIETAEKHVVVTDVKKLACILVEYEGSDDWEDIAAACDSFYRSDKRKDLNDVGQLAVALAYPTYESPYLEADGEDNAESAR